MKMFRWFAVGVAALLVAVVIAWLGFSSGAKPAGAAATTGKRPSEATHVTSTVDKTVQPSPVSATSVAKTVSPIEDFAKWAADYTSAPEGRKPELLAKGEELAGLRAVEMSRLIRQNPALALQNELPYEVRKQLPASISNRVEHYVSGRGRLSVYGAYPAFPTQEDFQSVRRELEIGKTKYTPHFAGVRKNVGTREIIVHGMALDGHIAVSDQIVKPISKLEAADRSAGGVAADPVCSVSGQNSTTFGSQIFALLGDRVVGFCHPSHPVRLNGRLLAAENQLYADAGGPNTYPTNVPPGTEVNSTQGRKNVLIIRLRFPDDPTEPITEAGAYQMMAGVNQFYVDSSYNTLSMNPTVTPLLSVPETKRWYGEVGGEGQLLLDGREAARAAGFDFRDYDLDALIFVTVPGFDFGGLAFVGARGVWLQSTAVGVAAHEFGHNLGLLHANFWQTGSALRPSPPPAYPFDSGSIVFHDDVNAPGDTSTVPGGNPPGDVEYGDPYDTMGSANAGAYHFSSHMKFALRWLPPHQTRVITRSETNRLYAFDAGSLFAERLYALRVRKDFQREYWIDHRQLFTGNPWQSRGVELHWDDWLGTAGTSQLIDSTPGSPYGKEDCAVVVGRTFIDRQAEIYITPMAKGVADGQEWIDVVVNVGADPDNLVPVIGNLSSSANGVVVGGSVNFNVAASDANGDGLAYHWDFGDGAFGDNLSAVSHTFTTAGKYVVRVEVSDLKGGIASAQLIITVGQPNVYVMSGQLYDDSGNPIANARVHNGRSGADYRVGWTDSQGFYAIGNVPPGSYTNNAFNYGDIPNPLFDNPVQVESQDVVGLDHLMLSVPHVSIRAVSDADEATLNPGVFEVTRTGSTAEDLLVYYVASGTATPDVQYTSLLPNSLIIPAGSASATLNVAPLADGAAVGPSTVTVTLRLATNEVKITSVVTNINNTNVIVIRTNVVTFPGWEAIAVNGVKTWFQTWPQYVLGREEATLTIKDADAVTQPPLVGMIVFDENAVESGRDTATIAFLREGSVEHDLNVYYQIADPNLYGRAGTNDYMPLSGVVTIPAGQFFAFLPIAARDDLFVEGNEVLSVALSPNPDYTIVPGYDTVEVLIVDDDLPLVKVSAIDPIAAEPNANTGTFLLTRAGDLSGNLVVNYFVTGTATSGVDFQTLPGQVTIPAGQVSATVTLTPLDDGVRESNEVVTLFLSESPTYNIGTPGGATVVIQDNELPTVSFVLSLGSITEGGNTPAVISVVRSAPVSEALTVNFRVGGTATEIADFSGIGTNITFAPGVASTNLLINPINDRYKEIGETVIVVMQPGNNYNIGATNTVSVLINDDDSSDLPVVGFPLRSMTVPESIGLIHIPVQISTNPVVDKAEALVEWHITGGSAVPEVDYSLSSTGILSFRSNDLRVPNILVPLTTNLDVTIFNNDFVQGSRTLVITLADIQYIYTNRVVANGATNFVITAYPTNAYLGANRIFTLTIVDDDTNLVTVAATQPLAREYNQTPGYFTINRAGPTNRALTVTYSITGSASAGSDFQPIPNQVVIPAGTNEVRVYVQPVDDSVEEYVETVQLRLISAVGGIIGTEDVATINIQDNDGTVQFSLPNFNMPEAIGTAQISVQRSGDTNLAVAVDYLLFNGSATNGFDYLGAPGTVQFAPGEIVRTIPVPLINDSLVESNETISLVLTNPTGGVKLGGQNTATVTIVDDDTDFVFARATYLHPENRGDAQIEIFRRGVISGTDAVTLTASNLFVTNGVAGSADYVSTEIQVVFQPGQSNAVAAVPVVDDELFEGDERVELALSNPTGSVQLGSLSNAVLQIVDDECAIDFTVSGFSFIEHQPVVQLTVRRHGGTVNPVTVEYFTSDGTALNGFDYVGTPGSVTFLGDRFVTNNNGSGAVTALPGETVQTINVQLLDDVLGEGDETFSVTLVNPQGPALPGSTILGTNAVATVTIIDNETPGNLDFEFASGANGPVNSIAVAPRGGLVEFVGRVVFGGEFTQVDGVVLNRVARLLPGGQLDPSFNPGAGANSNVLAVAVQLDGKVVVGGEFTSFAGQTVPYIARVNADGTFDTGFTPAVGLLSGPVRSIVIQTNGQILAGGDFTVPGLFTNRGIVRLNPDASLDAGFLANFDGRVNALALQEDGRILVGGAFTSVNGTNSPGLARLNVNGSLDNTLKVGTGFSLEVKGLAVQTDGAIVVGGSFTNYNGTNQNYLIRLLGNGGVDATFATGSGPDAPIDAVAVASNGKVVIGGSFTNFNGQPRGRFARLTPGGILDGLFVSAEGANARVRTVTIQPDTAIVIGGDFTQVDSLTRNYIARVHGDEKLDVVGVEFTSRNFSVRETDGQAVITLRRVGNTNNAFTVQFVATDLTAASPADYLATNVSVSFAAGENNRSVAVAVFNDALVEGNEKVRLYLTNGSQNVTLATASSAELTIVDSAKTVSFASASVNAVENSSNATVVVVRGGELSGELQVTLTTQGGTAVSGVDFVPTTVSLTFTNGEESKSVSLPLINDIDYEPTETFTATLTTPATGFIISPSSVTVNILDSDSGIIVGSGAVITSESRVPANGLVDSNETVTVLFGLRNAGLLDANNVTASLVYGGGITHSVPQIQNYGALQAGGNSASRPFTFTASGPVGSRLTATLLITNEGSAFGYATFDFVIGNQGIPLLLTNSIVINDFAPASPYPSVLNVSGVGGAVQSVSVSLKGLTHRYPDDLDILLVAPNGQSVMLMSDSGGGNLTALNNVNLTFNDAAASNLPDEAQIVSGTYRPSNYQIVSDPFASPAPLPPYGASLSALNGSDPNGDWRLFIVDDGQRDDGLLAGGWSLNIVTTSTLGGGADVGVVVTDSPDPVLRGGTFTYAIAVTNFGPSTAPAVRLSAVLPAAASLVSVVGPGAFGTTNGVITGNLGNLALGAGAVVTVTLTAPLVNGTLTLDTTITSTQADPNSGNNHVVTTTTVTDTLAVPAILSRRSGNDLVISWPGTETNLVLQSASSLGSTWTTVEQAVVTSNGLSSVTVPMNQTLKFFRLRRAP